MNVGVMKDQELKLRNLHASHTLFGSGNWKNTHIIVGVRGCVYLQLDKKRRRPEVKKCHAKLYEENRHADYRRITEGQSRRTPEITPPTLYLPPLTSGGRYKEE